LNALSIWLITQARCDEALPLLDRVYAAEDSKNGDLAIGALSNKGWCLYRLGEFDQSLALLQKLERMGTAGGTAQIPQEVYGHIGNIYDQRDDYTTARAYYLKALHLSEQRGERAWSAKWLGNLAHLSIQTKDWPSAATYNSQALSLARATGDKVAELHSLCDSAEILNGRGDFGGAVKLYQDVSNTETDDRVPALLAHAGLARLYAEHDRDTLADLQYADALNIVESRQSSLKEDEFKVSFVSVLISVHQSYIDFLMSHGRNERALEVAETSRARILQGRLGNRDKPLSVSAAAYQRLARESGLVLLSYSLGPERSYVWVTTGSGIVSYPLPPEEKIRSLVERYRAFVENMHNPLDTDDTSGDELYQAVLAPALGRIPAGSRLVIAPDQALHALNFETLPIPTPRKHYFLEDATVTVTPSLNLLIDRRAAATIGPSRLLLIGDPSSTDEHFPKLLNAAKEISLVQSHFPPAEVDSYREADATPAVYDKSPLDTFSYIHFTAHASTDRLVPLDSAIILSGTDDSNKLTAREVMKHPIRARLVTISACRGAGAKTYGGEGLVGFMWAFFQAGARNIIAGLWDVSDDSTTQLMDSLYGELMQGKCPADALRSAKLDLIRANPTWRQPYYWAPFQLYSRELPM
jgi:CHAT domain-containing protein